MLDASANIRDRPFDSEEMGGTDRAEAGEGDIDSRLTVVPPLRAVCLVFLARRFAEADSDTPESSECLLLIKQPVPDLNLDVGRPWEPISPNLPRPGQAHAGRIGPSSDGVTLPRVSSGYSG